MNTIINELEMSRNRNKKSVVLEQQQPTEEMVKSVMDLYKPNKIQKFFMRYFSPLASTSKLQNGVIIGIIALVGLTIVYGVLGLHQAAIALSATAVLVILPTVAGILYNLITNNKRVKQICSVLGFTEQEVLGLERTFYLDL